MSVSAVAPARAAPFLSRLFAPRVSVAETIRCRFAGRALVTLYDVMLAVQQHKAALGPENRPPETLAYVFRDGSRLVIDVAADRSVTLR